MSHQEDREGTTAPSGSEALTPGTLTLAATPLGNVGDATGRLREALATADLIASEDTRRTRQLVAALKLSSHAEFLSHHDHNEHSRTPRLLDALREGQRVLIVTDAGMPTVSDPGFASVTAAVAEGFPVTCLPGPSAPLVALALSGITCERFAFDGFAPRKNGARTAWLESLREERRAVIFFDSPHRVATTLDAAVEILGAERPVALCRELTKVYEEVWRGTLAEVAARTHEEVRGEVTVVLAPAPSRVASADDLVAEALCREEQGVRLKEACREAVKDAEARNGVTSPVSTRELYALCLAAR